MARELVTRRVLARELVVNAATRPLNVAVPAGVAVAGLLLHTLSLLPIALVVCAAMMIATFFDEGEAARVGRETYDRSRLQARPRLDPSHFAPPIAQRLELAHIEEAQIRNAIQDAPLTFAGLTGEVARLTEALDELARRTQRIYDYLDDQDDGGIRERLRGLLGTSSGDPEIVAANAQAAAALEDHLSVNHELERQLARFDAQMEHITASLGAIRGQIVRMSITEEGAVQDDVACQVRVLRREVSAAADAMRDAYREVGAADSSSPS